MPSGGLELSRYEPDSNSGLRVYYYFLLDSFVSISFNLSLWLPLLPLLSFGLDGFVFSP
jgi:hypothetical protein